MPPLSSERFYERSARPVLAEVAETQLANSVQAEAKSE
jgi:hypothetical protein